MRANDELASRMNVQVETRLLELVYRGRRPKEEAPYSIVRSYLLYAMAPPAPAELGISPGVAVIAIQRTSYDARGTVVETADLVMSGDRVAAVYSTPCARTRQPC
ncbi:UTRA domain-containing protein [Streptomyces sp. NPDC017056]|uniref:UTRA domain-containing protein n=1 Tax=Streptomyces sp. NPDC017056 TaxID=3364973 RepID=UPI0037B62B75